MPYEFDGIKYRQASSHQEEWGTRLMHELELHGNERVLDLGCGDGRLTRQIAEMVPDGSVVGIDSSFGMIDAAMIHIKPNLLFKQQDILELDELEEYDVIFSNAALHWVHDHNYVLNASYRALCQGGIIRFNFATEGNCSQLITVLHEIMAMEEFMDLFHTFIWPWYMPSVDAYIKLIDTLPFRGVQVWGEVADRYFPDINAMVAWIDQPSLVPFIAHLPADMRLIFRDRVVERMIALCRQTDDRCFEYFRRINVLAWK
ncbi:MAG: class I SAM-dependent methyltransferase [Armatimonadota bacterium]